MLWAYWAGVILAALVGAALSLRAPLWLFAAVMALSAVIPFRMSQSYPDSELGSLGNLFLGVFGWSCWGAALLAGIASLLARIVYRWSKRDP